MLNQNYFKRVDELVTSNELLTERYILLEEQFPALFHLIRSVDKPEFISGFLIAFFSAIENYDVTNTDFFNLVAGRSHADFVKRTYYFFNYAWEAKHADAREDIPQMVRVISDMAFIKSDGVPTMKVFRNGAFLARYLIREAAIRKQILRNLGETPVVNQKALPLIAYRYASTIEAMVSPDIKLTLHANWNDKGPWYVTSETHVREDDQIGGYLFLPQFDTSVLKFINSQAELEESFTNIAAELKHNLTE